MAEWYEPDPVMGVMTYTPLDNGEVWHLDKWACFIHDRATEVWLVPKVVTTLHLEEIEAEQSILLALLLEWEYLVNGKAMDMEQLWLLYD
jgi:hypothetical protein